MMRKELSDVINSFFRLDEHGTTPRAELIGGLTSFLTAMYILFVNSRILAGSGMPFRGVFIATALSAAVCTLFCALFANLPLTMAPGMNINSFFVNTICLGMGFLWQEALALTFISGVLYLILMLLPLRKSLVVAIPESLRIASSVGLGIFISYLAIKNSGLILYTIPAGQYEQNGGGAIIAGAETVQGMVEVFGTPQLISILALITLIIFLAMERKTGNRYSALPVSIMVATFIGIPMNIQNLSISSGLGASAFSEFREIAFSFFGSPGLLSLFKNPTTVMNTILVVVLLTLTNVLDSVGTMLGIGYIRGVELFDDKEHALFHTSPISSRIDRALLANAAGSVVAPVLGTSPVVIYMESVTGVISGARTGYASVATALIFLLCLPLVGFFSIVPTEAVTPAMLLAGGTLVVRLSDIDWSDIFEWLPAFITILIIPLTFSIVDGISIGIICHVVMHLAAGEWKKLPPTLYLISIVYLLAKAGQAFAQLH